MTIHRLDRTAAAPWTPANRECSNSSLARRDSPDTVEFHSRNHVRILSRGNSSVFAFPSFCSRPPYLSFAYFPLSLFPSLPRPLLPRLGSSALNFPAFPPVFPAREDRWRSRAPLLARSSIGVRKFDPFFFARSPLRIPGRKPHSQPSWFLKYRTERVRL